MPSTCLCPCAQQTRRGPARDKERASPIPPPSPPPARSIACEVGGVGRKPGGPECTRGGSVRVSRPTGQPNRLTGQTACPIGQSDCPSARLKWPVQRVAGEFVLVTRAIGHLVWPTARVMRMAEDVHDGDTENTLASPRIDYLFLFRAPGSKSSFSQWTKCSEWRIYVFAELGLSVPSASSDASNSLYCSSAFSTSSSAVRLMRIVLMYAL